MTGKTGRKPPPLFMAGQAPTRSEIIRANENKVGGVRKRCVKGKNCSAACISSLEDCLAELPIPVAEELRKVARYIKQAKLKMVGGVDDRGNQLVGEFQLLKTPKEAAEWLLAHKEELALWGIDDTKLQAILKYKPDVITVGIEPGAGGGKPITPTLFPDTNNIEPVIQLNKQGAPAGGKGSYYDQMTKVNEYKLALDTSRYLSEVGPEVFGKTYSDVVGGIIKKGFDETAYIKGLAESGNLGDGITKATTMRTLPKEGGKQWGEGLRSIVNHFNDGKFENFTTSGLNPSGLWKPEDKYNQFGELFEKAGMGDKAGPFKDQGSWLSYARGAVRERFEKIFDEATPRLVMITKNANQELTDTIVLSAKSNNVSEYQVSNKTLAGKNIAPVTATFVIKNRPNGENTVIVSTNHLGSGWKGSQPSRGVILQMAEFMGKTGRFPSESEVKAIQEKALKVKDSRPVESVTKLENPGDRVRREIGDKYIKQLSKENRQEKQELARQERQVRSIEKEADKFISQLRSEGKGTIKTTGRVATTPTSKNTKLSGLNSNQWTDVVNAPKGSFNGNQLAEAVVSYGASKGNLKGATYNKYRDIRRQVVEDFGAKQLSQGPLADELRNRLTSAGLLPTSAPSKINNQGQNFREHKPSTRWDMLPRGIHQPSRVG